MGRLFLLLIALLVLLVGQAHARKPPPQPPAPYKAHFSDFYQVRAHWERMHVES